MFKWSNVPIFQCYNVQIFKCSNVQIFKCSNFKCLNFSMVQCSNIQMFQFSNVTMFQCSNVQIFNFLNIQHCQSVPPEFLLSFLHCFSHIDLFCQNFSQLCDSHTILTILTNSVWCRSFVRKTFIAIIVSLPYMKVVF